MFSLSHQISLNCQWKTPMYSTGRVKCLSLSPSSLFFPPAHQEVRSEEKFMHFRCGGDWDLLCHGLITTINRGCRFSGTFSHTTGSFEIIAGKQSHDNRINQSKPTKILQHLPEKPCSALDLSFSPRTYLVTEFIFTPDIWLAYSLLNILLISTLP